MLRRLSAIVLLLVASATSFANNCEAIRAQIEAKVRASGVTTFTLTTVEANAQASGRMVGTCDLGTKKILYAPASSAASAASASAPPTIRPATKPAQQSILTECKDGSVSLGGDCKR